MLILTRRPVETIYIGDNITVTVLGVVGNQVRFGIEAPRHIVIDRAEIHEAKKREAAARVAAGGEPNGNVAERPSVRPEPTLPRRPEPQMPRTPEPVIADKPAPAISRKQEIEVLRSCGLGYGGPDSQDTRRKREGLR